MSEEEKSAAIEHLVNDCRTARQECVLLTNEADRLADKLERIARYIRGLPDSGIVDRDILIMPKAEQILDVRRRLEVARERKTEMEQRLDDLGLLLK